MLKVHMLKMCPSLLQGRKTIQSTMTAKIEIFCCQSLHQYAEWSKIQVTSQWCKKHKAHYLTRITQVWALMGSLWFLVLSSWVTKFVLKVTWLLDQWLGPTFPMDFVCIPAYLGCILECSGFPCSTPMFPSFGTQVLHDCAMLCNVPIVANMAHCMTMLQDQSSKCSKYRMS